MGTDWFNPYLVQVLTVVFMCLAPVAFGYLFHRCGGQTGRLNVTLAAMGVSCIVSPFWASQIYFFNQSAQVTCSFVLTALAVLLAEEGRKALRKRWYCVMLSVTLMQFTFSSYQVLAMVYVTAVAMAFLCSVMKEKRTVKWQISWILFHAGVFLAGLVLYWLTTKAFFYSGGAYLNGQLGWNSGIRAGLRKFFDAVRSIWMGEHAFYTRFYGGFSLLLLAAVLFRGIKGRWFQKEKKIWIIPFLALLFLISAPFVFIFFYGGSVQDRMQLVLPFSQGCMLYLIPELLFGHGAGEPEVTKGGSARRKWMRTGIAAVTALAFLKSVMADMGVCNRLYYTDEWVFQYDKQMAHDIYMELKDYLAENGYDESLYGNLIFLGYLLIPYNRAAVRGDVMGSSSFAFDIEKDDTYRPRIFYFMRAVGYPIEPEPYFTDGARAAYYAYFDAYFGDRVDAMPSFPDRGSIRYLESEEIGLRYLVVKLGPYWRSAIDNPANH